MSYWLQSEYAKWIHDPDDPEVKAEAERRKRRKVKPPPFPLIPPVAHRPPSVAEKYQDDYLAQAMVFADAVEDRGSRAVTSAEFDRALELL